MESASDQQSPQPDLLVGAKQRVEAASDFLSFCDRISTGHNSGYYWEDVQRALRIAAGLEQWRQRPARAAPDRLIRVETVILFFPIPSQSPSNFLFLSNMSSGTPGYWLTYASPGQSHNLGSLELAALGGAVAVKVQLPGNF